MASQESTMLIDLHAHSYPGSDDSLLRIEELITEAKRTGLDGLCLTEHDMFWDVQHLQALSREFDFPLFPGCEVTTDEGHLLVFGLQEYVFGMHRAEFVRNLIHEAGGAIIAAHPYRRQFKQEEARSRVAYERMLTQAYQDQRLYYAHGVEVLNGRGSEEENTFAQEICVRYNLTGAGGSDAHRPGDVGSCATRFLKPVHTLEALVKALRGGLFQPASPQKSSAAPTA